MPGVQRYAIALVRKQVWQTGTYRDVRGDGIVQVPVDVPNQTVSTLKDRGLFVGRESASTKPRLRSW